MSLDVYLSGKVCPHCGQNIERETEVYSANIDRARVVKIRSRALREIQRV